MDTVNENLMRSLVCDLEEADVVTKEIISYTGAVNTFSWKFPTCRGDTIEPMVLLKKFSGTMEERYVLLMELVIDRLNFFLYALMKFLDSFPDYYVRFLHCPYISPPSFMSFGALIHSTWNRVKTIYSGYMDEMAQKIHDNLSGMDEAISHHSSLSNEGLHKSTQTTVASLQLCENCHLSMNIVKSMVNCIENIFTTINEANKIDMSKAITESAVSKLKNQVKHEIWKVTQWKVMTQIAEAVTMDTNMLEDQLGNCFSEKYTLLKELDIEKEKFYSLNNERETLTKYITTIKNENSDLMNCNVKLEKMLSRKENDVESLSELLDKSKTLNENLRRECKDAAEELQRAQLELANAKEELELKSNEVCLYKKKYMAQVQLRKKAQEEIQLERERIECVEEQLICSQRNVEVLTADIEGERIQFLFQIQELQGNLQRTTGEKGTLAREVLELKEECNSFLNEISKLKREVQEKIEEGMLMAQYPDICGQIDSKWTGIPAVDMENQIKANNTRIKLLHDENAALEKTIWKLKIKSRETPV